MRTNAPRIPLLSYSPAALAHSSPSGKRATQLVVSNSVHDTALKPAVVQSYTSWVKINAGLGTARPPAGRLGRERGHKPSLAAVEGRQASLEPCERGH